MAVARCSECSAKLVYEDGTPKPAGTKTCCSAHKSKRARRLKASAKLRGGDSREAYVQEISEAIKNGDALHEAAVAEFRPLVREAMTASVLQGIDTLIGMTPEVMAKLQEHIASSDETVSQRALQLWFKHTLGNPSVAPASTTVAPAGLTVQFNVPRPGDDPTAASSVPGDAEELRVCDDCHAEKPAIEFVAGSARCEQCFKGMTSMLVERFGPEYKA